MHPREIDSQRPESSTDTTVSLCDLTQDDGVDTSVGNWSYQFPRNQLEGLYIQLVNSMKNSVDRCARWHLESSEEPGPARDGLYASNIQAKGLQSQSEQNSIRRTSGE